MIDHKTVLSIIEPPNGQRLLVKRYQDTDDIIKDLVFCFKAYNYQADPVAKMYGTGNIVNDGRNIHDYIKKNITYKAESEKRQTSRSFSRIIHDGWGDCKHTADIVASIGWNEGYNVILRYVRYRVYNWETLKYENLYHTYTILEDPKTGQQVIVDPLQRFNYEKPFAEKIIDQKAIQKMSLTRLSGTRVESNGVLMMNGVVDGHETYALDNIAGREIVLTPMGMDADEIGEIEELISGIGRRSKKQREEKHAKNKEKRKEHRQKRKEKRKQGGGILKKVALAPVRGAFSALLLINAKGFASRLKKAIDMGKENEVQGMAKKLGYNYAILKKQILKGATKHAIGAVDPSEVHQVEGMGVVITAAALTAAAPAIIIAVQLLKKLGLGEHSDDMTMKDAADSMSTPDHEDSHSDTSTTTTNTTTTNTTKPATTSDAPVDRSSTTSTDKTDTTDSGGTTYDKSKDSSGYDPGEETFWDKYKTPILIVSGIGVLAIGTKMMKLW